MKTRISRRTFGLAAVFLAGALPLAAYACSCVPPPPPKQSLDNASAVFSGKVTKTEKTDFQLKATIQVENVWKGDVTETTVVTTCSNGACCGFGFAEGESYLIYAFKPANADFSANMCSRTKRLADAGDDLKELGAGQPPKKAAN